MNGDKIENFLMRAEEYKNAKNYKKERELYSQILKLQPDNKQTKQEIDKKTDKKQV